MLKPLLVKGIPRILHPMVPPRYAINTVHRTKRGATDVGPVVEAPSGESLSKTYRSQTVSVHTSIRRRRLGSQKVRLH